MKIPIIVGVTGHRNLRKEDLEPLRNAVRTELQRFKTWYPNSPLSMTNSLAAGADQLCAEIAIELNIPVIVPLPMSIVSYRKDFEGKDLDKFNRLLEQSEETFIAPYVENSQALTREYFYRQAGLYIIRNCHVLLALWDGFPEKTSECGTAALVDLRINPNYIENDPILKPITGGAVLQIVTPRESQPPLPDCYSVKIIEKSKGNLHEILKKTEEFNTDIGLSPISSDNKWAEDSILNKMSINERHLRDLYVASDQLSIHFRDKYLKHLKYLSFCSVALVVSFLLYDELESDLFLMIYGIMMLAAFAIYVVSKRNRYHAKYLSYRTLAETARVWVFLLLMQLEENLSVGFSWVQDGTWIKQAVAALKIGGDTHEAVDIQKIKTIWIDDQLNYYRAAVTKTKKAELLNTNITRTMIMASMALFLMVIVLEFGFKHIVLISIPIESIRSLLLIHESQGLIVRGLLKILLGLVSATTVFLSNYYGKLSLQSKLAEYEKMAAIYSSAKIRFENSEIDKRKLLLELAREEMVENGNWLNYCGNNEVEIKI